MNVTVITTTVELTNSWRVDHDTLVNSILTSFKKFVIFLNTFIETHHWPKVLSTGSPLITQERQESNLQSRFWRPLVCH